MQEMLKTCHVFTFAARHAASAYCLYSIGLSAKARASQSDTAQVLACTMNGLRARIPRPTPGAELAGLGLLQFQAMASLCRPSPPHGESGRGSRELP